MHALFCRTDRNVHLFVQNTERGETYSQSSAVSNMISAFFRDGSPISASISLGGTSDMIQVICCSIYSRVNNLIANKDQDFVYSVIPLSTLFNRLSLLWGMAILLAASAKFFWMEKAWICGPWLYWPKLILHYTPAQGEKWPSNVQSYHRLDFMQIVHYTETTEALLQRVRACSSKHTQWQPASIGN